MKITIPFIASICTLFGQKDSLVRYYSTDMIRTNMIKGRPEIKVNVNESHFKATYYPSGRLKSIEFIPADWDKRKREKTTSKNSLKLYYLKWDPRQQELSEGITKNNSKGIAHYQALLNDQGTVTDVDYFDKNNENLWSFHLNWDDYNKSNEYDIEFHSERNLSKLNQELFAPDLSAVKAGWSARYVINSDGRPEKVKVIDNLGNLYYFYEFTYTKKWLKSEYFRQDSTLVGSHTTRFAKGKRVAKITYYNENGEMKNAIGYEYPSKDTMIISQFNSRGKVIEKRIIPLKERKK